MELWPFSGISYSSVDGLEEMKNTPNCRRKALNLLRHTNPRWFPPLPQFAASGGRWVVKWSAGHSLQTHRRLVVPFQFIQHGATAINASLTSTVRTCSRRRRRNSFPRNSRTTDQFPSQVLVHFFSVPYVLFMLSLVPRECCATTERNINSWNFGATSGTGRTWESRDWVS